MSTPCDEEPWEGVGAAPHVPFRRPEADTSGDVKLLLPRIRLLCFILSLTPDLCCTVN